MEKIEIRYFGQSCFELFDGRYRILFDPYLSKNPAKAAQPSDLHPDFILVSHGHADHVGDAILLSNDNDAPIVTTPEVGHFLEKGGCRKTELLHIGGKIAFPFGSVKATQALHGCGEVSGGIACGFLVKFGEKTFYFAGDTGLFGDMQLLGQYNKIDCAFLPIGDRFTMGPEDAEIAAGFLKAAYVIPMHYNGNAKTMQNPETFKRQVESSTDSRVIVMIPGETALI